MSLADEAASLSSDVPPAQGPKPGQASIDWDGTKGTLTTGTLDAEPKSWDDLITDWGLDPSEVQVVPGSVQIRAWDANVGGGEIRRLRYYKAQLERRTGPGVDAEDLAEIKKALLRRKPSKARAASLSQGTRVVLLSDWQIGKALHDDTPILTPQGWTTHGQLRPGDLVYGPDGAPKEVLAVTGSSVQPLYRVSFDDGAEVLASDEHIWEGWRRYKGTPYAGYERRRVKMTTAELGAMKRHGAHRPQGSYAVNALGTDLTLPLVAEGVDLPVDPYLLGAWLGDGNSRSGWLTSSHEDADHWLLSFEDSYQIVPNGPAASIRIPGLSKQLRLLGLLENKHIPDLYLHASAEQRLAVVQGLMDTDGHITGRGYAEFCQVNTAVADGMAFLLRSLGMKVKRKIKATAGQDAHILRFTPEASSPLQQVCRMERKAKRIKSWGDGQSHYSYVRSVERVEDGPAQCITVEGSLYLCGTELKVTHNSDGDGLVGSVDRIVAGLEGAARSAKGAERIVLAGMGDIIEQCAGHYPGQAFTVELDRREQMRVARRLILRAVDLFAPLAPVDVVAVPGNHGENRLNGKAFTRTSDNDDVAVFEQVADIVGSSERYPDVRFGFPPESDATTVTLDIGPGIALNHGHNLSNGSTGQQKANTWWKGQMAGHRPAGDCDILITGHYHHFVCYEGSGRTWFQCPAMDGGSTWWEDKTGNTSPPGMLSFTVGDYGARPWGDLALT